MGPSFKSVNYEWKYYINSGWVGLIWIFQSSNGIQPKKNQNPQLTQPLWYGLDNPNGRLIQNLEKKNSKFQIYFDLWQN